MTVHDLLFHLPTPQDWETRLQVTYIAPIESFAPNLTPGLDEVPPPRTNIVVSRTPTKQTDPSVECRTFIAQVEKSVPGFEEIGNTDSLTFDDGATGVIVVVKFPAPDPSGQKIWLVQLHAFRIDNGILTQLVGTLAEVEAAQERESLRKMLQSFALT